MLDHPEDAGPLRRMLDHPGRCWAIEEDAGSSRYLERCWAIEKDARLCRKILHHQQDPGLYRRTLDHSLIY
jgi:hypothetical protein